MTLEWGFFVLNFDKNCTHTLEQCGPTGGPRAAETYKTM